MPLGAGSSRGAGGCCWGRRLPDHPCALAGSPMVNPDGLRAHLSSFSPSLLLFAALLSGEAVAHPAVMGEQGGGLGAPCEAMGRGESFLSLSLPGTGSTQHTCDMMLLSPTLAGWGWRTLPPAGRGGMKSSELSLLCLSKH